MVKELLQQEGLSGYAADRIVEGTCDLMNGKANTDAAIALRLSAVWPSDGFAVYAGFPHPQRRQPIRTGDTVRARFFSYSTGMTITSQIIRPNCFEAETQPRMVGGLDIQIAKSEDGSSATHERRSNSGIFMLESWPDFWSFLAHQIHARIDAINRRARRGQSEVDDLERLTKLRSRAMALVDMEWLYSKFTPDGWRGVLLPCSQAIVGILHPGPDARYSGNTDNTLAEVHAAFVDEEDEEEDDSSEAQTESDNDIHTSDVDEESDTDAFDDDDDSDEHIHSDDDDDSNSNDQSNDPGNWSHYDGVHTYQGIEGDRHYMRYAMFTLALMALQHGGVVDVKPDGISVRERNEARYPCDVQLHWGSVPAETLAREEFEGVVLPEPGLHDLPPVWDLPWDVLPHCNISVVWPSQHRGAFA